MQQVGARAFASATPIDPRHLPAVVRHPGRQALINAGHVWVLHKKQLLQGVAALVCCVGFAGVYAMRDRIEGATTNLYTLAQAEMAHSTFAIDRISITGQSLTGEHDILAALGIDPHTSTVNFDVDAARAAIEKLPAVAEASIRKVYPDKLDIKITERVPVARWRLDGTTYVVDAGGNKLAPATAAFAALPLVVGVNAGDDAQVMIRALDQFSTLKQGLLALSRIADRRWDMIYKSGVRVQLPETGVAQALTQLDRYEHDYQLLERDVVLVDLRVPGLVAVKPSAQAVTQLAAAAKAAAAAQKKAAAAFKGDADYSAPAH